MGKVTYLIGAGASAGCLPVIKDIKQHWDNFENFIHGLDNIQNHLQVLKQGKNEVEYVSLREEFVIRQSRTSLIQLPGRKSWNDYRMEMVKEIRKLKDATKSHHTVD